MNQRILYNLLVILTISVWGVTFVSTKILLFHGMTPLWIFIIRFAIAYLCTLMLCHGKLWADSAKDELCLIASGLTGGSLYFIAENSALKLTFASNVSLIICATPVLTLFLCSIFYKQRIRFRELAGSFIAICGVSIVILNGSLNFGINPAGDILVLIAALCWAVYCLLLKHLNIRYSNLFITRKVFFYGFVSSLLWSVFEPLPQPDSGAIASIVFNLLFLSIVASFLCFIIWNKAVQVLGPEKTANYIYFTPVITIISSSLILGEPVTLWLLAGGCIIIAGVYLTTKN
ncbi:MAG: DMT family transporter [Paramuribaculum sp.]|nr:DMT family transporter [Paramuribaculum sp.]